MRDEKIGTAQRIFLHEKASVTIDEPYFLAYNINILNNKNNNIDNKNNNKNGGNLLMDDLNSLLRTAIDETSHVREGETFLVKDLFKGYEWNRIPKGDRLMLGSMFLSYIGTHDCKVTVADKGASGQQRYQKH